MRLPSRHAAWLLALTINAPALAAENVELATAGTPAGFGAIAASRETLVDIYFGDRKVGEALAIIAPGSLRFKTPSNILAMVPQAVPSPELQAALTDELATNSDAVCSLSNSSECGVIAPSVAGIIYDADRFRVDLFINPKFLSGAHPVEAYLATPDAPLSLVDSIGVTAAGTLGESSTYNVQNRTILALRNARIRANTSISSELGLVVDDLVGELDHDALRYSAGLFWSPGNEFTGQRRILGAGFGTQLDTWAEQGSVGATPLILFLPQPARVELLIDGRLVGSRSYEAGNISIDTSALPTGSYAVLLRIHGLNGSVREERRFFVKNAQVPPLGHPQFFAYAGLLANTRAHDPFSISKTLYYQTGAALRLSNGLAIDASLLGTQDKAIFEAGSWLIVGPGRFRAAGLASTAGDFGALFQGTSATNGPLSMSFDIRRIWSKEGGPLIPLASHVDGFDGTPPSGVQLANGSYTQATASLGLRIANAYLSVVGSYRKDRDFRADYTLGPSLNWPILTRGHFQLVLDASAQRTRTALVTFAGLRLLYTAGPMAVLGTLGHRAGWDKADDTSRSRLVGSLSAQYSHETEDRTLLNLEAGAERDIEASSIHGGGSLYSRFGNVRANFLHAVEGDGGTQYDLTFQSGIALGGGAATLGGRDIDQSALVISVDGDSDATFNVLVDDAPRGQVTVGQQLSLFVPGYRDYAVRLVPEKGSNVSYDSSEKQVTLYPGNVRSLAWRAESYFTVFGQALTTSGEPIADALVETPKGIAQTDSNGYFQVDVREGDPIEISKSGTASCEIRLPRLNVSNDFASAGKLTCQ